MDINIKGNPGTGNSFTQIIVEAGGVNNNNQAGVNVTNTTIIYGDGKTASSGSDMDDKEKQIIKTAILEFVGKLKAQVSPEWTNKYDTLWVSILAIPEVDAEIYDKGGLRNTMFNRALVGSIVKVMLDKGIFVDTANPTILAPLTNNRSEAFRKEMGHYPSEVIHNAIKDLIDKH